jgi:hypothetical protein
MRTKNISPAHLWHAMQEKRNKANLHKLPLHSSFLKDPRRLGSFVLHPALTTWDPAATRGSPPSWTGHTPAAAPDRVYRLRAQDRRGQELCGGRSSELEFFLQRRRPSRPRIRRGRQLGRSILPPTSTKLRPPHEANLPRSGRRLGCAHRVSAQGELNPITSALSSWERAVALTRRCPGRLATRPIWGPAARASVPVRRPLQLRCINRHKCEGELGRCACSQCERKILVSG